MTGRRVGVIGANSLVGDFLLPFLAESETEVLAFSRNNLPAKYEDVSDIRWCGSDQKTILVDSGNLPVESWFSLLPIWGLKGYLPIMKSLGVKKIIALSSSSITSREDSPDPYDQDIVKKLADGENELMRWAEDNEVGFTILRPTMIFSPGRDRNLSRIADFIKKFRFFPLCNDANGLRQPVHAHDVAIACQQAISSPKNKCYYICGPETMTYKSMIERIFIACDIKPRLIKMPTWLFTSLSFVFHVRASMVARMADDLIFSNDWAARDFSYRPRHTLSGKWE